jgi:hypothetical protein
MHYVMIYAKMEKHRSENFSNFLAPAKATRKTRVGRHLGFTRS